MRGKEFKVAAFTRVSTMEQHSSIVNQQEVFNQWFKNNTDCILYENYIDEGISGAKAYKRINWLRMVEDAKKKKFDIILCKSFSRFGRNQRETLTVIANLREIGIRFIFLEDNLDSDKDMANFGLMAWLAEKEANATSERLKYIWESYDSIGKIHAPRPAYGYNWNKEKKNYAINEVESEVVKKIFNWYLDGEGYNSICRRLLACNIPTKAGGKWQGNTIAKMLINETYIGTLVQAKTKTIDATTKNSRKVDKEDWIKHPNNHEAIIDIEVFKRVQKILNKRKLKAQGAYRDEGVSRNSSKSLFSNLLICSECGTNMTIKRKKRLGYIPYYQCINYDMNSLRCGHSSNSIKESELLSLVKYELTELSKNNYQLLKSVVIKQTNDLENISKELNSVQSKINKHIDIANMLLINYTNGVVDKELYSLQNKSLANQLKVLMKEKEVLEDTYNNFKKGEKDSNIYDGIEKLLYLPIEKWNNQKLKEIIENIYVSIDGGIGIKIRFDL
ncbi:MAG: recombinase family protein [Sarcina sp.]